MAQTLPTDPLPSPPKTPTFSSPFSTSESIRPILTVDTPSTLNTTTTTMMSRRPLLGMMSAISMLPPTPPETPTEACPPSDHEDFEHVESRPSLSDETYAADHGDLIVVSKDCHRQLREIAITSEPPECTFSRELLPTLDRAPFGAGAFSVVLPRIRLGWNWTAPRTYAIKKPANSTAKTVVAEEARVLWYLSKLERKPDYFAAFHGMIRPEGSLVMEAIDGTTMDDFMKLPLPKAEGVRLLTLGRKDHTFVGLLRWTNIARQLAEAFCYLKSVGVVHGDVKWNNIIIVPTKNGGYKPVVIDFSSGHIVVEGKRSPAISAVTNGYCSPELLAAHLSSFKAHLNVLTPPGSPSLGPQEPPHPVATYASDLYGLGMTLLYFATGRDVYDGHRFTAIYAREGNPIGWLANDDRILAAGPRSPVGKVLKGCFGKTAEERITIEELKDRLVELEKNLSG